MFFAGDPLMRPANFGQYCLAGEWAGPVFADGRPSFFGGCFVCLFNDTRDVYQFARLNFSIQTYLTLPYLVRGRKAYNIDRSYKIIADAVRSS